MKTFFYLLAAALLCGCQKPAAPAPVLWEYSEFKYHDPDYHASLGGAWVCYVQFSNPTVLGEWLPSNNVTYADQLLNSVGYYGWELAWSDGVNFIVKRPRTLFTNGTFMVSQSLLLNHPQK